MRREKKNATLMFRVADTEKKRAELHCKAEGIKLSDFLRDLLAAAFASTGNDSGGSSAPRCHGG